MAAIGETQMEEVNLYFPFPLIAMLWAFKLQFTGYLDAPADINQARKLLADKMRADPFAYISSLSPCEPSCSSVGQLVKKVFTGG